VKEVSKKTETIKFENTNKPLSIPIYN